MVATAVTTSGPVAATALATTATQDTAVACYSFVVQFLDQRGLNRLQIGRQHLGRESLSTLASMEALLWVAGLPCIIRQRWECEEACKGERKIGYSKKNSWLL